MTWSAFLTWIFNQGEFSYMGSETVVLFKLHNNAMEKIHVRHYNKVVIRLQCIDKFGIHANQISMCLDPHLN